PVPCTPPSISLPACVLAQPRLAALAQTSESSDKRAGREPALIPYWSSWPLCHTKQAGHDKFLLWPLFSSGGRSALVLPKLLHHPFPQAAQQRGGRLGFQHHQPVLILAGIDAGAGLQLGQHLALFLRDAQANAPGAVCFENGVNPIEQSAESDPLRRRDMDDLIVVTQITVAQRLALLGRQQIDLVHHPQPWLLVSLQFLEDAFDLRVLLAGNRAAGIRD